MTCSFKKNLKIFVIGKMVNSPKQIFMSKL